MLSIPYKRPIYCSRHRLILHQHSQSCRSRSKDDWCACTGGPSLLALRLTLGGSTTSNGNVAYQQLCTGSSVDLSQLPASDIDQATGFVRVTAGLLQNSFQDCVAILDQITSFEFQLSSTASSSAPVSFCLDDISLLPPTLQTGNASDLGIVNNTMT